MKYSCRHLCAAIDGVVRQDCFSLLVAHLFIHLGDGVRLGMCGLDCMCIDTVVLFWIDDLVRQCSQSCLLVQVLE